MHIDRRALSEPSWSLLEIAAKRALLRHFACSPLAVSAPAGVGVRWVVTGIASNIHNGVVAARLSTGNADEAITATLRRLSGHPAIWYLSPEDTPADLPQRLIRAGCRPERTAVTMGAPCHQVVRQQPSSGVRIEEIVAAAQIDRWAQVADPVWQVTGPQLHAEADMYASLPLGPDALWRHWLATTGGPNDDRQPIGMVSGLFTPEAVMVEHVGVIPDRRGAGIGAALVTTVVADAAGRGVPYAVLGPTPQSRPLYQRLGFSLQNCVPDQQFYLP